MDLGTLIVAGLRDMVLIQLIIWFVPLNRYPGLDELRLDQVEATSTKPYDEKVPLQTQS